MAYISYSIFIDLFVVIACCLFAVHTVCIFLYRKWASKGIPSYNVHPILGNFQDIVYRRKILRDVVKDFYLEHKDKPFIGFFSFTQPMIMINDMELVKNILVKDFNFFADRNFSASTNDPLQYHSLFSVKGQSWKNLRVKLTPTFTSGKMKMMFEYVDACGKMLTSCIEKERNPNGDIEMKEMCARFTSDVIASCAFGIDGHSLEDRNSTFWQMMKKSITFSVYELMVGTLMFLFPSIIQKLNIRFTKKDVEDFVRNVVLDTVEHREKNNITRNDFLQLLIQLKKVGKVKADDGDAEVIEENNEKIDLEGDKFVSQCFLFLVAGFETSSTTMSYALYEMAINPDIQERVYQEIKTVLDQHDGKISYDAVQNMTYLHMVFQETLRKYPVLYFLDRQVTRAYRLPGTAIELARGDSVMVPVIGLHYDPALYPEPQRFDPERFGEEQRRARPPCAFLGFGDGPRNCIGMRMAWMQTKVGIIHLLLQYEVSPSSRTPIPIVYKSSPINQAKGGIPLKFKKRNA